MGLLTCQTLFILRTLFMAAYQVGRLGVWGRKAREHAGERCVLSPLVGSSSAVAASARPGSCRKSLRRPALLLVRDPHNKFAPPCLQDETTHAAQNDKSRAHVIRIVPTHAEENAKINKPVTM